MITRRSFLITGSTVIAGVATGAALPACSADPNAGPAAGPAIGSAAPGSGRSSAGSAPFALARRFPNEVLVPGELRLPVSIVQGGTVQLTGPKTLSARVVADDDTLVSTATATRRDIDPLVAPYWAFRVTVPAAGIYTLRVDGDDGDGAAFEVFDAATVTMPHIGSTLQPFDTPTVDDHRGVEPYCSLTPDPCPLHEITLAQALQGGQPFAYMVGTPAHCQTGACAPGLEFLMATHARVGAAVTMVHADVFADNAGTVVSPAVNALGLSYEPVVYLCTADGTIVDQLDGVWNQTEIDEAVDRLLKR